MNHFGQQNNYGGITKMISTCPEEIGHYNRISSKYHIYRLPVSKLNMTILKLTIETIPSESRFASLAKLMSRSRWNRIRRSVYRRAGFRCRICRQKGRLHCHEVWQYNEKTGCQQLLGFQALCRNCHNVKHILFAKDCRQRARLLDHFISVNQLTRQQGINYLRAAYRRQQELDQRQWIVSYGNYNWHMPALKNMQQRRDYAKAIHTAPLNR